jgi:hypothetical protein
MKTVKLVLAIDVERLAKLLFEEVDQYGSLDRQRKPLRFANAAKRLARNLRLDAPTWE